MTDTPYDRPSDPAKRHSAALTDGADRAPARAMLKGTGFTDEDLARPLVGVATSWIETMPCNLNQRALAQHVKRGIRDAGGTPMEFNTIAVSDGVSMGTEGMRASLVSREVIADSIELVVRGHLFDGLVCLVGCDKTIPAAVMALARLDVPGLALYNGSIAPGRYKGADVTIQDVFEAVGAHAAGTMSGAEVHALESVACPGAGACGGQFTANTMSMALDFLGISPAGLNGIPALHASKEDAAYEAGVLAMRLVRDDVRPSQIITREALDNAAASIAASGGSTNGVLHLLAIARELDIPYTLEDFDAVAARTPVVASIKPGGRFVATDMHAAGGVALVARELLKRDDLLTGSAPNVDGRSLTQIAEEVEETAGQEVVVPLETPLKATGGLRVIYGNLSPDGAIVKLAGHERLVHRGPARVFDSEEACFAAVKARSDPAGRRRRDPLRRPRRRPRHAGDAPRDRGDRRRRAVRLGCPRHRWALLGGDARIHGRPRHSRGIPWRAARRARGGGHGRTRRRRHESCESSSPTTSSRPGSRPGHPRSPATRPASSPSTRRSFPRPRRARSRVPS